MNRITVFIICLLSVTEVWCQIHCVSRPWPISTEMFPHNGNSALTFDDYLMIYPDSIEFDNQQYALTSSEESPFENKDDLLRLFSCYYDFFSFSENIQGAIIHYHLEETVPRLGQEFRFIHFIDNGNPRFFIYSQDGLYSFSNHPSLIPVQEAQVLIRTAIETEEVVYATSVDTTAHVTYLETPLFDTISQLYLGRPAYQELEIIPAEFLETYEVFVQEQSDCEAAIYDTTYHQILVKEGGINYVVSPAVFESVSEIIVIQDSYEGEAFYERKFFDSLLVESRSSYYEIADYEITSACDILDFWDCIDIQLEEIPGSDTILYNVYERCQEGYKSAGKYCYVNDGIVPYILEERSYQKLVSPATAVGNVVPSEYVTIYQIAISNKEELDSSCIQFHSDSIQVKILETPAEVIEIEIPAAYDTFNYIKHIGGGKIDVVPGEEDINLTLNKIKGGSMIYDNIESQIMIEDVACHLESIRLQMIELGYLDQQDVESMEAILHAILTIQVENELPLGVIDHRFLDFIEVKFGY